MTCWYRNQSRNRYVDVEKDNSQHYTTMQKLLTQLVNKLGDPERKVASRAAFFLLKLGKL